MCYLVSTCLRMFFRFSVSILQFNFIWAIKHTLYYWNPYTFTGAWYVGHNMVYTGKCSVFTKIVYSDVVLSVLEMSVRSSLLIVFLCLSLLWPYQFSDYLVYQLLRDGVWSSLTIIVDLSLFVRLCNWVHEYINYYVISLIRHLRVIRKSEQKNLLSQLPMNGVEHI